MGEKVLQIASVRVDLGAASGSAHMPNHDASHFVVTFNFGSDCPVVKVTNKDGVPFKCRLFADMPRTCTPAAEPGWSSFTHRCG